MREWFNSQSPRDQMAILLLTGFLLVFSVFQFALMPMSENRAQMALNNGAASAQLSRVEAKVSRLLSLRDAGSTGQNDNLSSTLSAAAQNAGLTVKRLQPNSRGEVQVRFEGADFDALLQWLQTVEGNEGLRIIDASVSDAGRSGGVNATLRVRGQ
ncbi:MAG TPA: type II secretory protein PulM [Halieaceae bacterium]|nr:type II secretion system protein M [Pseudomonadales bacterium]MDA0892368.1 type II secretion system protein GspM [Pseudomonadota bacterium]RPH08966.1 MAG: type II secretion system protein M [Alteromonadaceae bacterium TMED101]CAI8431028.1 MAG: Type II secretion system protein M [Halieaceae bacterium]RPH09947.1 MAG: type II secretion system protein M [Alteromonadaceae bacterium TMED101]